MAAESPPLTSPKPPNERLGSGVLIDSVIAMHSDAITPPDHPVLAHEFQSIQNAPDGESGDIPAVALAVEESVSIDDELELRNAIESDLFKLTVEQAEIEWEHRRSDPADNDEEGKSLESLKKDCIDGTDKESLDDERENDESEGGKSGYVAPNLGRYNQSDNRRRSNYPVRPGVEDCAFYMKFGSCKFESQCKFNHPPRRRNQGAREKANYKEENSERAGQIECKYYLTTGGCKYGKDCKYSHGPEKSSSSQSPELNFLGLPIRPGEKECPYYMRTGSCKYGTNCRFHHPEPTSAGGSNSPGHDSGGTLPPQFGSPSSVSPWASPETFNKLSPFIPKVFPSAQDAPLSNPEWKGYQAAMHPPTSGNTLPIPPAFAMNNLSAEIPLPPQYQNGTMAEEYPERPGEPECTFFMKNGDCKFKSSCKFHHPKHRISKPKVNSYSLNDKGLPLRPDQPVCTHYHRYGICKFGPACKYDHPAQSAILQTAFDQPKLT